MPISLEGHRVYTKHDGAGLVKDVLERFIIDGVLYNTPRCLVELDNGRRVDVPADEVTIIDEPMAEYLLSFSGEE